MSGGLVRKGVGVRGRAPRVVGGLPEPSGAFGVLLPGLLYPSNRRKATDVLCPPKPNALESATRTSRSCGSLNV